MKIYKYCFFTFFIFLINFRAVKSQTHISDFKTPVKTLFTADGTSAITYQPDNDDIFFWDIESRQKYQSISTQWIKKCILSEDKKTLMALTSWSDDDLFYFDVETGSQKEKIPFYNKKCNWFHKDIAVGIHFYNYNDETLLEAIHTENKAIWKYVIEKDKNATIDNIIYLPKNELFIYELVKNYKSSYYKLPYMSAKPQKIKLKENFYGPIYANIKETQIVFSNGTLYDLTTDKIIFSHKTAFDNAHEIIFFDNDDKILIYSRTGKQTVVDSKTGEIIGTYILKSEEESKTFEFSGCDPEHKMLAYTCPNNTVHIVNMETGKFIAEFVKGDMLANPYARKNKTTTTSNKNTFDWTRYIGNSITIPNLIKIFQNNNFSDADFQELAYKHNFKSDLEGTSDYYTSPDNLFSIIRAKGSSYLDYIYIDIKKVSNLDFIKINSGMTYDDLENKFGPIYKGNWKTGILNVKNKYSIMLTSGSNDASNTRFTVSINFDAEGKTMKSLTLSPLVPNDFNCSEDIRIINSGCIRGNCENGDGAYQWVSGQRFEGSFKNSEIYLGNIYKTQFSSSPMLTLEEEYKRMDYLKEYLEKYEKAIESYNFWVLERNKDVINIMNNRTNADTYVKDLNRHHEYCLEYLSKAHNSIHEANNYVGSLNLGCSKAQGILSGLYLIMDDMQDIENSTMHSTVRTKVGNVEKYREGLANLDILIKKLTYGNLQQHLIECGFMFKSN